MFGFVKGCGHCKAMKPAYMEAAEEIHVNKKVCIYIYMKMTQLQLGKLKENCSLLKLYRKLRKMFLSPRRESNPRNLLISGETLTGDQKVAGSIPVWGSETFF